MADASEFFGGGGSAAAAAEFGGANPVQGAAQEVFKGIPAGSMLDAGTFSVDGGGGGGLDLKSLMAILGGLGLVGGDKKQSGYPAMVPPQSMVISPPASAQGPTGMPLPRTRIEQPAKQTSVMQQAAANKLREDSSSGLGGTLGTLAGGLAGFAIGGPAGAATGAGLGKKLGSSL